MPGFMSGIIVYYQVVLGGLLTVGIDAPRAVGWSFTACPTARKYKNNLTSL